MKAGAFVMYLGHAVLLDLSAKFSANTIYSGCTVVGFLPVKYKDNNSPVKECTEGSALGTELSS